ncbi:EAL domain-containing protein [Cedecea sp. NFIX57]|uniref:EAL domain-containing protein n=1 Tax=Cedecea sp. NFIX57 TaxID=1566286 RepID=UPI000A0D91B2|nr:EAL domain-containing protein [Cedecea sp. NFIX57]SMG19899.1 EAL domain, c-di-GMP-specific phosphodiesterase class I (or its enzymatically inactive variant) [Cedecea sp. NFIX57]
MNITSPLLPVPSQHSHVEFVYHILSACHFSATGLSALLHEKGMNTKLISPEKNSRLISKKNENDDFNYLIVFIPEDPFQMLMTLKSLILLLQMHHHKINTLIISSLSSSWLFSYFKNVLPRSANLSTIRIVSIYTSVVKLRSTLHQDIKSIPTLVSLARQEERNGGLRHEGLTIHEVNTLLELFSTSDKEDAAAIKNFSTKTLYNLRSSGLKKLAAIHPMMARLLPGRHRKTQRQSKPRGLTTRLLSSEERKITHALQHGLIFPVFQPIVDSEMQIVGFEIFCRWYTNGNVLLPKDFFHEIRTRETWVMLTAYIIREAVVNINNYAGKLEFSVNIPRALTEGTALFKIVETAKAQLLDPTWIRCLVLDINENVDLSYESKTVAVLNQLISLGVKLALDDCFAKNSVAFPVRQIKFNSYKFDRYIVETFINNHDDKNLIDGLIYYASVTGSQCIAEGVDSLQKLIMLKQMGVNLFQGYYISKPVLREELDALVFRGIQ